MTAPIPRDIPDLPAVPRNAPILLPSAVPATAVMTPVRHPLTAAYRLLVALLAAAAVTVELLVGAPLRMLSYFSIQTGILLAVVMALSAQRAWAARRPLPSGVTGATLLYVTVGALVYHLLLDHSTPPFSMTDATRLPAPWHGQWTLLQVLHVALPLAALADWLLLTPPGRLHLRQAASWLLYPLAYLAFCLTRAELLAPGTPGRVLYPFLNAPDHGYRGVLANALLVGLAIYGLAVLLVALDHLRPNPVRRRAKTGFRLRPPVG
ncbi:Pr6Pr family membrane protein [Streptomyces sp. V3I7]|uniref:Pr6Pr family membrane protein n=1 Tax=Streptomyces sp. V3I7 TaxID=3042278 RepID=UPI002782C52D|nr:Pr6Pr family membrane protein [Streptomyces sp. V3I7]MDQ0992117.1 hypothetical protein [Streptomyces sp. V3I7]